MENCESRHFLSNWNNLLIVKEWRSVTKLLQLNNLPYLWETINVTLFIKKVKNIVKTKIITNNNDKIKEKFKLKRVMTIKTKIS